MLHGFACVTPCLLGRTFPVVRLAYPSVSPHPSNGLWRYRNFNRLSIAYAFQPRLRSRLTLGGRPFPRNPWVFGGQVSHLPLRVLIPAFSLVSSPPVFTVWLQCAYNAPLPIISFTKYNSAASVPCFSPVTFSAQGHLTSELLRTL